MCSLALTIQYLVRFFFYLLFNSCFLRLSEGQASAIELFDSSGLPVLTAGECSQASNVLCSIYRHAVLVTDSEGGKSPLVAIDRRRRFDYTDNYCSV